MKNSEKEIKKAKIEKRLDIYMIVQLLISITLLLIAARLYNINNKYWVPIAFFGGGDLLILMFSIIFICKKYNL